MCIHVSAATLTKYYRFIYNVTALAMLNYACVILYGVPLFAFTKGEVDHLASSWINVVGFARQWNYILESFSFVVHSFFEFPFIIAKYRMMQGIVFTLQPLLLPFELAEWTNLTSVTKLCWQCVVCVYLHKCYVANRKISTGIASMISKTVAILSTV